MKKYKIRIRAQSFTFEDIEEARKKVKEVLDFGLWFLELDQIGDTEEKKEEKVEEEIPEPKGFKAVMKKPKRSYKKRVQKVPKKSPGKRSRRTKAEMIAAGERIKEIPVRKKRTSNLFSKEAEEIIKENWKDKRDVDLAEMIKEKLDITYTKDQVKARRKQVGLVKARGGQATRVKGEKRKMGNPKKYTDEAVQFMRDRINDFSNRELVKELQNRFNIKTSHLNLPSVLNQRGIKRELKLDIDVDPKIKDFVLKSKTTSVYAMRDEIIEKFEVDIPVNITRKIMNQRDQTAMPGEGVDDEVKRIEKKREEKPDDFDEEIDELDLD